MFTGIITGLGLVENINKLDGLSRFQIRFPTNCINAIEIGASVCIDGVCLTVTGIDKDVISFDAMQETLSKTALSTLSLKSKVNLERSARFGTELGGHVVSGHVDDVAEIISIENSANNCVMTFKTSKHYIRYLFEKGFVALNGASLTVSNLVRGDQTFQVWLIPETLRVTNFAEKKVGDKVNLEVDRTTQVIVETVERLMEDKLGAAQERVTK